MKQRINIIITAILFITMTMFGACSSAKKSVVNDSVYTGSRAAALGIEDALNGYKPWNTAEISGKVRAPGLPLSVTLKIYMLKDSALTISARAILVGEVGRVELTKDSLVMINKLKKVYCRESAGRLNDIYPSACGELQSILLGRMIVPGSGEMNESNLDKVKVSVNEDNARVVTPVLGDLPVQAGICYILESDGHIDELIASGENDKRFFSLDYEWKKNGAADLTFVTTKKNQPYEVDINLDAPKWETTMPAPAKISESYKRVGLKDFFKSF